MSIIKDMSDIKDMYNLCKFIESEDYHENIYYDDEREEGRIRREDKEVIELCVKQYSQYTKKNHFRRFLSKSKVSRIFNNAVSKGYILYGSDGLNMSVDVTSKGLRLISKEWYIFKRGLREETINEYPKSFDVYKMRYKAGIAIISAIIGSIASMVVCILYG